MKPHLAEDIIPVSKFKKKTSSYLHEIKTKGRTVVLTQNGHSAAVILSPESYEQLQYEKDLFAAIARGEREIKEGKGIPHKKGFKRLWIKFEE